MEEQLWIYRKIKDGWLAELSRIDRHRIYHLECSLARVKKQPARAMIFLKWSTFFRNCMIKESWEKKDGSSNMKDVIIARNAVFFYSWFHIVMPSWPLREIPYYGKPHQEDWRERLLQAMDESKKTTDVREWFEIARYIKYCPNCFSPNLQSFNAYPYMNTKGFCCPVCGCEFEMVSV
jgi:hypothetical protein